MRFRHTDMLKETLRDITQQTLAQACKICLRDVPCPQLDCKRVLGFDNAKAGDIVTPIALLDELRDLMRFINAAKTVEEVRRRLTRADRARRLRGPGRHLLARQHGSSPNGPAAGQRGAVGTKRARS